MSLMAPFMAPFRVEMAPFRTTEVGESTDGAIRAKKQQLVTT